MTTKTANNQRHFALIVVFSILSAFMVIQASATAPETVADTANFQTDLIDIQSEEAGIKYPKVSLPDRKGETITAAHEFRFNSELRKIEVELDKNEYLAAEKTSKNIRAKSSGIKAEDWTAGYYQTLITDSINLKSYSQITKELQKIKNEEQLNDDEYADLIVTFVQSLPYETTGTAPKYPIETLYEMKGDCDDKSLLLSAILTLEGYDNQMVYFKDESHVAVEIRTSNPPHDSEYAFIETTATGLIGIIPEEVNNHPFSPKTPITIPISREGKEYTSYEQNLLIQNYFDEIKSDIAELKYDSSDELKDLHTKYNTVTKNITNRDFLYEWVIQQ